MTKSLFTRPATRTTKTISSASDSLRSSILPNEPPILPNERILRENGDMYTYVNFQPEIPDCELVILHFVIDTYLH